MHIQPQLVITVDRAGWSVDRQEDVEAHIKDIEKVIQSCAGSVWNHCANTKLDPIFVRRRYDHPHASFARDEQGRIVVGLNTQDNRWAQFVFQFGHEFCHVLAIQSNDPGCLWHDTRHANHWLEESICEAASLFALRAMSVQWKSAAPYAHWRDYSEALGSYAQSRMDEVTRQTSNGTFAEWFITHEPTMRANSVIREDNCVVAAQLLPLFESNPSGWESMTFFNRVPQHNDKSLSQHFVDWHSACPANLQDFVVQLASVFSITIARYWANWDPRTAAPHIIRRDTRIFWKAQASGETGQCIGTFIGENPGGAISNRGPKHEGYSPVAQGGIPGDPTLRLLSQVWSKAVEEGLNEPEPSDYIEVLNTYYFQNPSSGKSLDDWRVCGGSTLYNPVPSPSSRFILLGWGVEHNKCPEALASAQSLADCPVVIVPSSAGRVEVLHGSTLSGGLSLGPVAPSYVLQCRNVPKAVYKVYMANVAKEFR